MLAEHGLSYTPDQVRAMSERDRGALLGIVTERRKEAKRQQALAEARANARGGRR